MFLSQTTVKNIISYEKTTMKTINLLFGMERELKLGWEERRKLSFLFLVDCTHTLRQTSRLDEQRERELLHTLLQGYSPVPDELNELSSKVKYIY